MTIEGPSSGDIPAFGLPPEDSEGGQGGGRGSRLRYVAAILLLTAILVVGFGTCLLSNEGSEEVPPIALPGEDRPLDQVSTSAFDAELLWQYQLESANMPADVAIVDGRVFVLDTNNSRILELDDEGNVVDELDAESDGQLDLIGPMAMTSHEGKLYVSNSGAGNIIVLSPHGTVEDVITPQVSPPERSVRPIGIAITPNDHIFVSDPDNHRVLLLDEEGRLVSSLGSGTRDSGEYGFNTPGGLSLDAEGNLYVVDMLNYAVKKYSPADQFLLSVGEPGDTEGTFSRPKVVAVDGDGRIFVSDTLLVSVAVFDSDGNYLGFIGREDPDDRQSDSLFQAPHGMEVADDTLYVVDRFAGVFAFQIPEEIAIASQPSAD
jgi:DNA-binding beta-propeller fold protein YncE